MRSLPEILNYFTVYGLESDSKTNSSNEQQFYLVNKDILFLHEVTSSLYLKDPSPQSGKAIVVRFSHCYFMFV